MNKQPNSDPPPPRQPAGAPAASAFFETPAPARLRGMRTIGIIVASILALASASAAIAETYPAAPVKLIVTTGAGGAPDVIARIVAEGLSRRWGQQVFVSNEGYLLALV